MAVDVETRYPTQLSAELQTKIENIVQAALAEIPEPHRTGLTHGMKFKVEAAVKTILAEVSEIYKEGLTRQVALLTVENEELKERLDS